VGRLIDLFTRSGRRDPGGSVLGRQITRTLPSGLKLPAELEQLFGWIETHHFYRDAADCRIGFLSAPENRVGTDIEFRSDYCDDPKRWLDCDDPQVLGRLGVFARAGKDGSMAAFWLADDGSQKIVHLGSGSGSLMTCVLADHPTDFLRLLAIGYDEICWGDEFAEPPDRPASEANRPFKSWVEQTFGVAIPERGTDVVKRPAGMDDDDSADPFWRWLRSLR